MRGAGYSLVLVISRWGNTERMSLGEGLLLLASRFLAVAPLLLVWSVFFFQSMSLLAALSLSLPAIMVGTVYMLIAEDL